MRTRRDAARVAKYARIRRARSVWSTTSGTRKAAQPERGKCGCEHSDSAWYSRSPLEQTSPKKPTSSNPELPTRAVERGEERATVSKDIFGRYSVHRWHGATWIVMQDRSDGARTVCSLPMKTRKEAREWAAHFEKTRS